MPANVKPIPDNHGSITPTLVCRNAAKAIDFYKSVLGATETARMKGPEGKIMHAELKIGNSGFFISDAMGMDLPAAPEPGITNPMLIHLYVEDVDAVFARAAAAGARVDMPTQDMFWGDRYGRLTDPFGQQWSVATHKEDLSAEEIKRRQDAFFSKAAGHH